MQNELLTQEAAPFEVPPIPAKANLYTLDGEVARLEAQIKAAEGEASDELIDAYLNAGGELKEKINNYGKLRAEKSANAKRLRAEAQTFLDEAKRLEALAEHDESTVNRLDSRLKRYIQDKGIESIETERFRFSVASVGGNRAVVLSVAPDKLPARFRKREIVYKADTAAIRVALESGSKIRCAYLKPRATVLQVK